MPTASHAGNGRTTGPQASLTYSATTNGDPLVVGIGLFENTLMAYSGVTFNSVAMIPTIRELRGSYNMQWFVLPSPGSATANVVVTPATSKYITSGAINVDDFGAITRLTMANGSSTAPTVDIPSATGELILDMLLQDNNGQTYTEGGGQTKLYENTNGTDSAYSAMSTEAGGSTVTMSWTLGSSDAWVLGALAIVGTADGGGGGGDGVTRAFVFGA